MSKFDVVIDSLNPNSPVDGSPKSLTGVKEIIISNIQLNESCILMHLITTDISRNEQRYLTDENSSITLDYPRNFDGLFFVKDFIAEGVQASFDLELINLRTHYFCQQKREMVKYFFTNIFLQK